VLQLQVYSAFTLSPIHGVAVTKAQFALPTKAPAQSMAGQQLGNTAVQIVYPVHGTQT